MNDHFLPCTERVNKHKARLNVVKSKTSVARNRSDEFTGAHCRTHFPCV